MENPETLPVDDHPAQTGIQVLLIEDNPADARLFKEYLAEDQDQVYVLSHVETLGEALEAVHRHKPDVIVLDLSLPDAQGLEGLRQIAEAASAPVVVHSGVDDRHMIAEAVKQGAQDYLVKGRYDADLLERVLSYAIERQQTLRVVQDSEKRLRSIIEHTSDGVVIVSAEGTVIFANPAAEVLLGSSANELLGQSCGFPLTTDKTTELEIVNKKEGIVTVETRVTPILWKGQNAFLASLFDISAHKQLQDQLTHDKEKAEELAWLKSSFLASMSHELRTPLTGVMGFADTLIGEVTNP
ncbi:MAG: response regulator, partial [Bacteroidetes bacterium]|nr:response regulator [Bacteroidota bacterium]